MLKPNDMGFASFCDVDEQNEELEALNAIALAVGSTLHIEEVLNNFLVNLAKLVPYDSSSIALWKDNRLQLVAERGLPDEDAVRAGEVAMNQGQRWQRIREHDDALILRDVRLEPNWVTVPGLEYIRCWMAVPLVCKGRVIGVLHLDKREPDFYTPAHAKRVRVVAQQVAIAIENAQLYSELEARVAKRTGELQAQIHQTEAILRNVADGIMFTDQEHRIIFVNPAWEKITGFTAEEAVGKNASHLLNESAPPEMLRTLREAALVGRTWRGVAAARRKDGTRYDAEMTISPIRDEAGTIHRFVTVHRDVTEALNLEAVKMRFVADVAHDLGNPVANLKLRVSLLKRVPERMAEHLAVIERQTERMDNLIKDLLTLSRLDLGVLTTELTSLNLNTLVTRIVQTHEPTAETKGLALTFEADPDLPRLLIDARQIERVIVNLTANALNYTPSGGTIHMATTREANTIVFTIRDTGIGITPEALPYIFERFYRSDEAREIAEGTGLGLAIVKEIVSRFGGAIDVESKPGQGSEFSVFLPAMNLRPAGNSPEGTPPNPGPGKADASR